MRPIPETLVDKDGRTIQIGQNVVIEPTVSSGKVVNIMPSKLQVGVELIGGQRVVVPHTWLSRHTLCEETF